MNHDDRWKQRAACQGFDPDMWFPEVHELTLPRTLVAKRICSDCPVRAECYEFGKYETTGIWGGVYFAHRSQIRERSVS